tara:strand:+ start:88 stop:285 length:198 start_codon:yes stop_codon:yes gene_type:complete
MDKIIYKSDTDFIILDHNRDNDIFLVSTPAGSLEEIRLDELIRLVNLERFLKKSKRNKNLWGLIF